MDLNDDGVNDILSGSYSRNEQPMAGLFQVLWGKSDGTFQAAEVLKGTDDEPLLIPNSKPDSKNPTDGIVDVICTRPTAVDWDGDGKLDIITGNFTGTFYLFKGEGKGKFDPKGEVITVDDKPLRITGSHSDPFMVDWDGDGDLDLLSGSSDGGVQWSENTADKGNPPKLKPFRSLIDPTGPVEYGKPLKEADLKGPTRATRIWVDDVNSDGKLDVLVGDSVTLISLPEGLDEKEAKIKADEWQKEVDAVTKEMQSAGEDQKKMEEARKRFSELYSQRSNFIKEEMTGFVWLYLQK